MQRELSWVWIPAEVLLLASSVAAILLLDRIFDDGSFLGPILFTTVVAHGLLIAMRWMGFGSLAAGLTSFVGTAAATVAIHYSSSAVAAVVPTGATVDRLRLDLEDAGRLFDSLQAPVPAITGFLVISSIAFWIIAFASDWAAFRMFAPGQALVPVLTVLIFVALLGVEAGRVRTTGTIVVCGLLFVLAHRAARRVSQGTWLGEGPVRGFASIMGAGLVVGLIAILVGVLGGPVVPGANEAPLVELGDNERKDNKPLEVISPLVQIQPRLVNQSDRVMFTVESTEPAFWRIAALDEFDGSLWRSQGTFGSVDDDLDVAYPSRVEGTPVRQQFNLESLGVLWMPAAYTPTKFENLTEIGVKYESETATLIVDSDDQEVSDGLSYQLESSIPRFNGALLTRLAATSDDRPSDRYLQLPDNFSPLARQEAQRITAGLTDPHAMALALQNHFQDNFTYDLNVAEGHNITRLEDFLTIQRGYCEQFAGTMAAMARSVGLHARVATGFTEGEQDPANPNRLIVRGKHAHAWPEIYIPGAGWMYYEPTPGRGAPNTSDYTGVPEAQEGSTPESPPEEAAAAPLPEPETAPTQQPEQPTAVPTPESEQPEPTPVEPATTSSSRGLSAWLLLPLFVLFGAAAWFFGIPALKKARERKRIEAAAGDRRRLVALAWSSTVDRLEGIGAGPTSSETPHEYAQRVEQTPLLHRSGFDELTNLVVEAAYRPDQPTGADVQKANELADSIANLLTTDQSWSARNATQLDPRPLLGPDLVAARASRIADGATGVATTTSGVDEKQQHDADQTIEMV